MTPYTVRNGCITPPQVSLFKKMCALVERVPDPEWSVELSCHHLCHALARICPGAVAQDGYFGKGCEHSWLVLEPSLEAARTDWRARIVADMYPWGGASPLLVYTFWSLQWNKLYIADDRVIQNVRSRETAFDVHVEELVSLLQAVTS